MIRQLQAYFDGELRDFDLPLAPEGTEFQLRVWNSLRSIPYGETISYAQLAHMIGNPQAVRALVKTQQALKADVSLATKVGRSLFPASEAELIADVVARDLPFYDAAISREFVTGMTEFQRHMGLLTGDVSYDDVVATRFSQYWKA